MIELVSQNAGLIGLLFFFSVFVGVAAWAFYPGRKATIESYKFIPLSEENHGRK